MVNREESRRILAAIVTTTDRSEFEDLMADVPSREVLTAYVAGSLDPDTMASLRAFFDEHPEYQEELDDLGAFLDAAPPVVKQAARASAGPSKATKKPSRAGLLGLTLLAAAGGYGGGRWQEMTHKQAIEKLADPNARSREFALPILSTEDHQELAAFRAAALEDSKVGRAARIHLLHQIKTRVSVLFDLLDPSVKRFPVTQQTIKYLRRQLQRAPDSKLGRADRARYDADRALQGGNLALANDKYAEATASYISLKAKPELARTRLRHAVLDLAEGRLADARFKLEKNIYEFWELGYKPETAFTKALLALLVEAEAGKKPVQELLRSFGKTQNTIPPNPTKNR